MLLAIALVALSVTADPLATPHLGLLFEPSGAHVVVAEIPRPEDEFEEIAAGLLQVIDDPDVHRAIADKDWELESLPDARAFDEILDDGRWGLWFQFYETYDGPPSLMRDAAMDFEPIRAALLNAGYDECRITVQTRQGSVLHVRGPTFDIDDYGESIRSGYFDLQTPIPPLVIRYGIETGTLLRRLALLLVVLLIPPLVVLRARKRCLQLPLDDPGWAWFLAYQTYFMLTPAFWVFWISANFYARLPLMFAYLLPGVPYGGLVAGYAAFTLAGLLVMVLCHVILHPVLMNYPGATWSRIDLLRQAFWWNVSLALLSGLIHLVTATQATAVTMYVAMPLSLGGALYTFRQWQHAFGFGWISVENQALCSRAAEFEAKAGVASKDLAILSVKNAPAGFGLSSLQARFHVSRPFLETATQREVDAIVARQVARRKRDKRFRNYLAMTLLCAAVATIGLVGVLFVRIALAAFSASYDTSVVTIQIVPLFMIVSCLVVGYSRLNRRRHQMEFAADAAAIKLTDDPEAMIAAIVRGCGIMRIPLNWKRSIERWNMFPSPANRIARIAKNAGIDDGTLARIVRDGLDEPTGFYARDDSAPASVAE